MSASHEGLNGPQKCRLGQCASARRREKINDVNRAPKRKLHPTNQFIRIDDDPCAVSLFNPMEQHQIWEVIIGVASNGSRNSVPSLDPFRRCLR